MPNKAETVICAEDVGDEELFRRGVPQVADWLRCWRAGQTPASFQAAEKNGTTENFIHCQRNKAKVGRRTFKAMTKVMSLVLRRRKLRLLKKASSIAIGMDDRGPYRIIAFRCNVRPGEDVGMFQNKKWTGYAQGILGVLRRGGSPSSKRMEDLNDDYSKAMADSVTYCFRRLVLSESDRHCRRRGLQ